MPPDPNMTGAELILEARIDPFDSRALAVAPRFGKHIANRAPRLASRFTASLSSTERRGLMSMIAVWPRSRISSAS